MSKTSNKTTKSKKLTIKQRTQAASSRLAKLNVTVKGTIGKGKNKRKVKMIVKRAVNGFTKRVQILGIAATSALRGLGAKGFSVSDGMAISEHFKTALNPFTVASHISKGSKGVETHGKIPAMSTAQLAEAKRIVAKANVSKEKQATKIAKTKKQTATQAVELQKAA